MIDLILFGLFSLLACYLCYLEWTDYTAPRENTIPEIFEALRRTVGFKSLLLMLCSGCFGVLGVVCLSVVLVATLCG